MSNGQLTVPPVAVRLLVALAVVQGIRSVLPPEFDGYVIYFFGFDPFRSGSFDPVWLYGAVTSVFVHGSWLHLLANATWIFVLSPQIAPHFTPKRFVVFFALTGACGALAHMAVNWGLSQFLVGASGSVFGMLGAGAYVLIRGRDGHSPPTMRDVGQYIVVMMIVNLGYAMLSGGGLSWENLGKSGISWEAHAGGFFGGLLLFPFMRSSPRGTRSPGILPD